MSKSESIKLEASKKWLEKNAHSDLNLKPALAAVENAGKAKAELAALKTKVSQMTDANKKAIKVLDTAIANVKTEKKLKAKEAKLQAKLASLVSLA
jgi:hypothetical protein